MLKTELLIIRALPGIFSISVDGNSNFLVAQVTPLIPSISKLHSNTFKRQQISLNIYPDYGGGYMNLSVLKSVEFLHIKLLFYSVFI